MGTLASARRHLAATAAEPFGGVLSRALLTDLGIDRKAVAREVAAERWLLVGRLTVLTNTGIVSDRASRWRAVWECGPDVALDGVSALHAAGVRGFDKMCVHVSAPRERHRQPVDGVRVHRLTRLSDEIVAAGIPRVRPAIAAVRAAHWATSDRQAALLLVLPVQQRIVTGSQLLAAAGSVHGRRRRQLVRQLVRDVADGAQSLGELDFAALCRRRGLPSPDRQVVRRSPQGRVYLDVRWSTLRLVVEIDGVGHRWGLAVTDDNLRQNRVVIGGDVVLRIDLVGLRLTPDTFMDQLVQAHSQLADRRCG